MTREQVRTALEMGVARAPNSLSLCDYAAAFHATLSELARNSGWVRAVVLRAVAGWITDWRRGQGCPGA
jgi:hypothetical protein